MEIYDILLHTPLGRKKGELSLDFGARDSEGRGGLSGSLVLFLHKEPIRGEILGDGSCSFTGRLVTLIKPIDFTASGSIRDDSLSLRLTAKAGTYEMTGARRRKEER